MSDTETNSTDTDSMTVIEGGVPDATIYWWSADDSSVASFAATEMRDYLEEMSGATVLEDSLETAGAAIPDAMRSAVVVVPETGDQSERAADALAASSEWLTPPGEALADSPPDSFVIQTVASATVLAGNSHRGTLYAAYDLLEELGVRFFAPDFAFYEDHAEFVPSRATVELPVLNVVERPSLEYRRKYVEEGWSHTPRTTQELIDWMAKTRHNVLVFPSDYRNYGVTEWDAWREDLAPELAKRGLLLEAGGHGFDSFLPPEEYGDDHPEWFVEEHNVFDVTDEAAVETYVENVIDYLQVRPEVAIFDAWPPDQASWPPRIAEEFGSVANAYAHVVNRLDAAVEREIDRDVRIETAAYSNHIELPDPEYMYDESIVVDFAPFDRSYAEPIFESDGEMDETYVDLLDEWCEGFDGALGLYEYYRKYSWHSLPMALPDLIGREIPYYESVGLTGVGIYSEPADWIPYELNHLLVAALSWDTDLDAEAYVDTYRRERFGPVADEIEQYLELVETAGRTLFTEFRGRYDDADAVSTALENYREAGEVLADARESVEAGTAEELLLRRLHQNAEFAAADTAISLHEAHGDHEEAAIAKQRMAELLENHRFDGIVLQAHWTVERCIPLDVPNDTGWMRRLYRDEW